MFKGDMDIYISIEKFEEIFGITSTVNINRLQISAETSKELPALVHKKTAQDQLEMGPAPLTNVKYPLRYALDRSLLSGSVLDYSITTSLDKFKTTGTSYTVTGGAEVAGGDIQGSVVGDNGKSAAVSDMHWRYVTRGNNYFSSLTAGQLTTVSGFIPKAIGIAVTNEPVEPRVMFDNYVVDGFTDPQSDVELYLNDRLIGFQRTNAAGYYRFQFPLTYGTEKITVKTFSKYGDINVSEKQVQVPFSFVPKGVLSYTLQAGKVDDNTGAMPNAYFGNAHLNYGATNWLTLNTGIEQSEHTGIQKPIYDVGFSSRLFTQYIFDVDVAPDAYYRVDANALFASNAGLYASYAKYVLNDSLLGATPQQSASLALYFPFSFISTGTSFRISEDYSETVLGRQLATRFDFSTRLTNIQLLLGYSENKIGAITNPLALNGNGILTATAMYIIPSVSLLPRFLQASLLRSVATYDMQFHTFQDLTVQLSKTVMQIFQFNLGFERKFTNNTTMVEAGLIMDLNFTRTSSVFDYANETVTSRQSVYGSVSFDRGKPFLSNREQVGKGGVNVLLFVDNNYNGKYDAGDELIPARGVKVDGMGKVELGKDSIIRVTQLESYFRYNLEVDRQQIDPNLVPIIDKFSFVIDPNQMRKIEIPFYRGGTISGNVYFDREGMCTPLSGGRVILLATKGNFGDTLHTFADGGFYAMNLAPGNYTLAVDPVQLKFIQAIQKEGPLTVTVHRSAQGDIVENLVIVCESLFKSTKPAQEADTAKFIPKERELIVPPPVKREPVDSTIRKEYSEPVPLPARKENSDTTQQKEITETTASPAQKGDGSASLREEYTRAVSAFQQKNYEESFAALSSLLEQGIEKSLAGNCEYWMGECKFALREYRGAIDHFQKVLSADSTSKKPDAYFMLGRSYEQTNELVKARKAYQLLNSQYPDNVHARRVTSRLKALEKLIDDKSNIEDEIPY